MPSLMPPPIRPDGGATPRNWREYQRQLQGRRAPRRRPWTVLILIAVLIAAGVTLVPGPEPALKPSPAAPMMDKAQVRSLIKGGDLFNRPSARFSVTEAGRSFAVETTLDMALQQSLVDALDTDTARFIGIVAVSPASGKVLAMAGYDRDGRTANPCLDSRFPAASVFKIITAAAAIEQCQLGGDSQMTFNGGQHTLYRRQLKEQVTRYTTRIRLEDAFAKSVNPVFGKLGALKLGCDQLSRYADAFGFNRHIGFETALPPSRCRIEDDPYRLAEIASGFNRETTLSPLHGALIAAAAANAGRLYEPSVVARILDADGNLVYRGTPRLLARPITEQTAAAIAAMMEASVARGTCRAPFRDQKRHPVLRQLIIGGKSGSIDNQDHSARIDWFVGFAQARQGNAGIAVAAVVAHEKYIGTRAAHYARQLMTEYFGRLFASRPEHGPSTERAAHQRPDKQG